MEGKILALKTLYKQSLTDMHGSYCCQLGFMSGLVKMGMGMHLGCVVHLSIVAGLLHTLFD